MRVNPGEKLLDASQSLFSLAMRLSQDSSYESSTELQAIIATIKEVENWAASTARNSYRQYRAVRVTLQAAAEALTEVVNELESGSRLPMDLAKLSLRLKKIPLAPPLKSDSHPGVNLASPSDRLD